MEQNHTKQNLSLYITCRNNVNASATHSVVFRSVSGKIENVL